MTQARALFSPTEVQKGNFIRAASSLISSPPLSSVTGLGTVSYWSSNGFWRSGGRFLIWTNHHNLIHNFHLAYCPGSKNIKADTLSLCLNEHSDAFCGPEGPAHAHVMPSPKPAGAMPADFLESGKVVPAPVYSPGSR